MKRSLFLCPVVLLGWIGCSTVPNPSPTASTSGLSDHDEFDRADTDHDGDLDPTEVALYHHEKILTTNDADRDSYLSLTEWEAASPASPEEEKERFEAVDRNRDRRISRSEAAAWVTQRVSFGNAFKEIDRDSNASLKWKEMTSNAPSELRLSIISRTF